MSVVSQLYHLQEMDMEIESSERTLNYIVSQLGDSKEVIEVQNKLALERQQLDELTRQQRVVEWEIDDISSKMNTTEEELYSGRIRNPKELTSLQQEIDILKINRRKLEDRVLEIMEKVELVTKNVSTMEIELGTLKSEWQNRQQKLSTELDQLKLVISELKNKRELLAKSIDPQVIDVYHELKRQRGTGVAKVEQGICRGCRISLPVTELQRVRGGSLVRCSSCGRILFLA
jgi:predicted  nucleic acid-binding Zn-ribbon protein